MQGDQLDIKIELTSMEWRNYHLPRADYFRITFGLNLRDIKSEFTMNSQFGNT